MINVPETFPEGPCKRYFKGLNLDTASKAKKNHNKNQNHSCFRRNFFPTTQDVSTPRCIHDNAFFLAT